MAGCDDVRATHPAAVRFHPIESRFRSSSRAWPPCVPPGSQRVPQQHAQPTGEHLAQPRMSCHIATATRQEEQTALHSQAALANDHSARCCVAMLWHSASSPHRPQMNAPLLEQPHTQSTMPPRPSASRTAPLHSVLAWPGRLWIVLPRPDRRAHFDRLGDDGVHACGASRLRMPHPHRSHGLRTVQVQRGSSPRATPLLLRSLEAPPARSHAPVLQHAASLNFALPAAEWECPE